MSKFHGIDADIWEELLGTPPKEMLLYIYFFSNPFCRPSGLYKIRLETIEHHTGLGKKYVEAINGKIIDYDFETSEVFVRGKMKRILSGFSNNSSMRKAVKADYEALKSVFIKHSFYYKYEGALEGLVSPPIHIPLPYPLHSEKEKVKEEKKHTSSAKEFFDLYNATVTNLPKVRELTDDRESKVRLRLRERPLAVWKDIFERMDRTPFLNGENNRGWRATFDWIIANQTNAAKVLEGKYDSGKPEDRNRELIKQI